MIMDIKNYIDINKYKNQIKVNNNAHKKLNQYEKI